MSHIWLVTLGSVRVQADLKKQLPNLSASGQTPVPLTEEDFPDEAFLALSATGALSLNEEPVNDLPQALKQLLNTAGNRKLIVTLIAHEKTPYSQVIQTLNALKNAGIENVTFTVGIEEGF